MSTIEIAIYGRGGTVHCDCYGKNVHLYTCICRNRQASICTCEHLLSKVGNSLRHYSAQFISQLKSSEMYVVVLFLLSPLAFSRIYEAGTSARGSTSGTPVRQVGVHWYRQSENDVGLHSTCPSRSAAGGV